MGGRKSRRLDDPFIMEGPNNPADQAHGPRLEKDILAQVTTFNQCIPDTPLAVFAGNSRVFGGNDKGYGGPGHPHLSQ